MYEGPDFMIAFRYQQGARTHAHTSARAHTHTHARTHRYQLILKFIFMGLMFSTAIPLSSFVVALFLCESYLIDKYNLCRQA
jgi:hypothetical protein